MFTSIENPYIIVAFPMTHPAHKLPSPHLPLSFIDLGAQQKRIRDRIDHRIKTVLDHGAYIMGPEVFELEEKLAHFCGAKYTLSCANGTDALGLVLMAKGVGEGDAVFVPSFTFAATGEVVAWTGATAIFVDADPKTFNMCAKSLENAIATAQKLGLTPKMIMPVDVFGLPADFDVLLPLARKHDMFVLDDAAQGFGGTYKGKRVGSIGDATATSFFPAKPLGCYGDGGAVFTDDLELYDILKSLRVHGQGADKYHNVRIGMNGRLDTLQAGILLEKLAIFEEEIHSRNKVAHIYKEGLGDLESEGIVTLPHVPPHHISTWAQYTILLAPDTNRDAVAQALKHKGIPTAIYYPVPLHLQPAYKHYPTSTAGGLPVCEDLAKRVLSLPMHPYINEQDQTYILEGVKGVLRKGE